MANENVSGRAGKAEQQRMEVNPLEGGLPWAGAARDIDPNEDAWKFSAPPPAGIYEVQLALFKCELVKYDPKDENTWGYEINIEGRTTEKHGDHAGSVNFLRVTTYRRRGAKISTAEGALIKLGLDKAKLAARKFNHQEIAEALVKALNKGPITNWEIDWRGSYQDVKEKWHNVFTTYDEFPDDPETGGKQHVVKVLVPGGGREEITAQTRVIKWIGKGEALTTSRKAATATANAVADSLDLGEPVKANGAAPAAKPVAKVEDELDLS